MLYKRGSIYWYKFDFCGQTIRESTKSRNKSLAEKAERKRRQKLEEHYNGVKLERPVPILFRVAGKEWLELKAQKKRNTCKSARTSLGHLTPVFGDTLLPDIDALAIARYVGRRREEKAADSSIRLEYDTLRGILKRAKLWGHLADDEALPTWNPRLKIGKVLATDQESRLLAACRTRRNPCLYVAVMIAIHTGMRDSEIRTLWWWQIDFEARTIIVGDTKTIAGTGRVIEMNDTLYLALRTWANQWPNRRESHCVFPRAAYAHYNRHYAGDVTHPIGSFYRGWISAQRRAGVWVRFHDLRHTFCTRVLERGTTFEVLASLMGWSPAQTTKMFKIYGHISRTTHRKAVNTLDPPSGAGVGTESGTFDPKADTAPAVTGEETGVMTMNAGTAGLRSQIRNSN